MVLNGGQATQDGVSKLQSAAPSLTLTILTNFTWKTASPHGPLVGLYISFLTFVLSGARPQPTLPKLAPKR